MQTLPLPLVFVGRMGRVLGPHSLSPGQDGPDTRVHTHRNTHLHRWANARTHPHKCLHAQMRTHKHRHAETQMGECTHAPPHVPAHTCTREVGASTEAEASARLSRLQMWLLSGCGGEAAVLVISSPSRTAKREEGPDGQMELRWWTGVSGCL